MTDTIDRKTRNQLVDAYWTSFAKVSWPHIESLTDGQVQREYARQDKLLDQYAEVLVPTPVSRCPFCDEVTRYAFDPLGYEGMWWAKGNLADFAPPEACEHFRLLLGGIDFHTRAPEEAAVHREMYPGPGRPFVVPRLLELPGVRAVLSSFELPRGDRAYLTAYFSEEPIHPAHLHQPWCRQAYALLNQDGEYIGWTRQTDLWDFDLVTWWRKGNIHWIRPDDPSWQIAQEGACPYLDLPGIAAPQGVFRGKLEVLPLPDGLPLDMSE